MRDFAHHFVYSAIFFIGEGFFLHILRIKVISHVLNADIVNRSMH